MKVSLRSRVLITTIDLLAVDYAPAFVIPEGVLAIQAIGRYTIGGREITRIYVENNSNYYMIEVWEYNNVIESLMLAKNVLYATPQSKEDWDEAYTEASQEAIQLDGNLV